MTSRQPCKYRGRGERGAALIVALLALVALLGIGGITMLAVQSEIRSSGNDRFEQMALYAAESGAAAGMEYLRTNCNTTTLFSTSVEPNNVNPQSPAAIIGNSRMPGTAGNPFALGSQIWYQVILLNNREDGGLVAGNDEDGQIVLRSIGHGPNQTQVTLETVVVAESCISAFCASDYAQQNLDSGNTAFAVCAQAVDPAGALRTFTP